ncbi:hydantoinase/oxoprolinase N-terminal domain-containing protein [Embleya scabrispora]|uniref:hydantoinase/oxoprolinase N-terminal domain-containing protein n=1 Tax=Embleya scabrispora TaxID=159449 RepID=UPI0007C5C692|nr:hydantoinase/oxoprolinase N-terminal domain-containing protein [Embleya scabrispora]MYS84817.1 hydantoinase [Streptomyces sp. SID5474]
MTGARTIGVDVGPTNTDGALLVDDAPAATVKVPSAADPVDSVRFAVAALLREAPRAPRVTHVAIGLRSAAHAVTRREGLTRVGVLRIGGPVSDAVPPLAHWPADLRTAVHAGSAMVEGGAGLTPADATALDGDAVARFAAGLAGRCDAFAVTGVFSPIDDTQEQQAAEIIRREVGADAFVGLSAGSGGLGLIERENSIVLDAALSRHTRVLADALTAALGALGLSSTTVLVARGDGTLTSLEYLRLHPSLALGSGPAGTLRGAGVLTGLTDAVVADVGARRIRVGLLAGGFPQESRPGLVIGGVPVSFPMPDLIRVPADDADAFEEAVDRMQPGAARLPLVVVGGGSAALAATRAPAAHVLLPEHGLVAGAFGAALSPVGGAHERLMRAGDAAGTHAVDEVREGARRSAVRAGADPRRIVVLPVERVPVPYLPGPAFSLRARAVGPPSPL